MESNFIHSFNKEARERAKETGVVLRPFVGDPSLLPLAERQEVIYKFQYLEESIESLALQYRLAPPKLETWLKENKVERKRLVSDEEIQAFEKEVTETYKSIQTRLIGLTVLHSAKAWQSLARVEEELLASLENAAKAISEQVNPDHRMLSSLANTHERIVNQHTIIQEGLNKAKETGSLFQAITRIERVIVNPEASGEEKDNG